MDEQKKIINETSINLQKVNNIINSLDKRIENAAETTFNLSELRREVRGVREILEQIHMQTIGSELIKD